MPRKYTVSFDNVTVTVAQDLVYVKGATGKMLKVTRVWCCSSNTALPTAQQIRFRGTYLPATVTVGSGGGAVTPQVSDAGDAAASFTARINDTTPATTNATAATIFNHADHIHAGLDMPLPGGGVFVGPTDAFTFGLSSTVSGTVALSGGVEVEEMGGAA